MDTKRNPPQSLRCVIRATAVFLLAVGAQAQVIPVKFVDASFELDFVHRSGEFSGDGLAGAAWLDFDNDGHLDLFLTNGKTQANGLFRNNGDGAFTNVAAEAGVENGLGNSGVVAADFDNDGWKDLFLTGEGGSLYGTEQMPLKLYLNNGDGTFSDITRASGLVSPPTALDPAVADIDNDGDLDIFICAPGSLFFQSSNKNELWMNNGDLTFTNISARSGVNTSIGACAAIFMDYNSDGRQDLFIANCNDPFLAATPMELHRNDDGLTFSDMTNAAGLNILGLWMGISSADYDNDGDLDVFMTNVGTSGANLPHTLLRYNGRGTFTDVALSAGVGLHEFGWGCSFTDFDNDGWADLYFAGSLVGGLIGGGFNIVGPGLGNPGTILFNNTDGAFTEFTHQMPVNLENRYTSGVAYGDYDADGFSDILVMTDTIPGGDLGTPVLLKSLGNDNNWMKVKLEGTTSNRDAVGAKVIVSAGAITQTKAVFAGTSLLSTDSQILTFGLAQAKGTDQITVVWPSGLVEEFDNLLAGETVTLVEGSTLLQGDLNGDGMVNTTDLLLLLGAWGACDDCGNCAADLDNNCQVGSTDLIILLGNWG